ncbi:exodeoxyribonuclease-like [Megachile rotundata]|uniref:exodeoxyribonuclease-like n=1 Tax=Megachile rotundata TaxID=143995 RepID=UPI003FCF2582
MDISRQIKIISANVNSIVSNERRHNILELLKAECPDFLLLNESKLKPQLSLNCKKYTLLRNDRVNSNGGGVAILIKQQIQHKIIDIPQEIKVIECLSIKIKLRNKKNIIVTAGYTPGSQADEFVGELAYLSKTLEWGNPNNFYILGGDLNAEHPAWNNSSFNSRGRALNNWINDNVLQ